MPKLGMEPVRKDALIRATIAEIGAKGSLDITVSQIAQRAGMSSALAHHYFGSKEDIFLAAMRHILSDYSRDVKEALKHAKSPYERVLAILEASLQESQFTGETVAAWLNFYVKAQESDDAARLLRIYSARLQSNLSSALETLVPPEKRHDIVEALSSLIDGFYIRHALQSRCLQADDMKRIIISYVDANLIDASLTETAKKSLNEGV